MSSIYQSAIQIADRIRRGELSARDVLEEHVARIGALNPKLNAIVQLDLTRARARAEDADRASTRGELWGPLHGVPMTVKDGFDLAGVKTTIGMPHLLNNVPERNASVVDRLQSAGAIVFGKSNLPLASYDWQCVHPSYGRTVNPWSHDRTPGGSSGGSAAALAAGLTPIEFGSDAGGSIRIPASFCGVFGLRPTEGVISAAGHGNLPGEPTSLRNIVTVGPLSRSAKDLSLLFEISAGTDPRSWTTHAVSEQHPIKDVATRPLRIAWTPNMAGIRPAAEVRSVLDGLIRRLKGQGHFVEEQTPALDMQEVLDTWGLIQGFEMRAATMAPFRWPPFHWLSSLFFPLRLGFSRLSAHAARGYAMSSHGYFAALTARDHHVENIERFLSAYDVWLSPAAPVVAFEHQRSGAPLLIDGRREAYATAMGAFACPHPLFGSPVVCAPAGLSESGLPVGIQIAASRFADRRVLAVTERWEAEGLLRFQRPPMPEAIASSR